MIEADQIAAMDQEQFYAALNGEDPLTVVIRVAIHVEHQIVQLIEGNVVFPDELKKIDLSFSDRAYLAAALGLRPSLVPPIKALGTIRNGYAHRLDAQISEQEANNFYQAFSPTDRQIIERVYQRVRKLSANKRPSKFSSLSPLDRFILCAVSLRGALVVARAQAARFQLLTSNTTPP